jgi:hypothetical protein
VSKQDGKHLWEATAENEKISYLREMVVSQGSIATIAGSVAVAAVMSVFIQPVGLAALPVLAAIAGQSIAALFVPSSPVFRAKVNRRKRRQRRDQAREHMEGELRALVPDDHVNWSTYQRMRGRLESLESLAASRGSTVTESMVEQLQDATVDYLGLWLAWLTMRQRWESVDEPGLKRRVAQIEAQMDEASTAVDQHHLKRAHADLSRVLERRQGLWSRATSVEAAMLAMADTFEEVYQRVMANPNSSDLGTTLEDAVERMRVEEQLDLAVEAELSDLMAPERKKKRAGAATKQL